MKYFFIILLFSASIASAQYRWVEYKVTGTAQKVSITYSQGDGSMEQLGEDSIPWHYITLGFKGVPFQLSAQNLGDDGEIIVSIYVKNITKHEVDEETKFANSLSEELKKLNEDSDRWFWLDRYKLLIQKKELHEKKRMKNAKLFRIARSKGAYVVASTGGILD